VEEAMNLFLTIHEEDFRMLGMYQGRRLRAKHYLELSFWFSREKRFIRAYGYLCKALKIHPFQNPAHIIGICLAAIDGIFKTSLVEKAFFWKFRTEKGLRRYMD
jgi:hypothetical protein